MDKASETTIKVGDVLDDIVRYLHKGVGNRPKCIFKIDKSDGDF